MKRRWTVMAVLLLATILACPSFAQPGRGWDWQGGGRGGGERGGGPGWGDQRDERERGERGPSRGLAAVPDFLLMDLNLSPEQASKVGAIRNAHLKDIEALRDRISGKEKELAQLSQERPDLNELIQGMQQEIANLKKGLQEKRGKYLQDVRDILTPEQNALIPSYGMGRDNNDSRRGMGPGGGSRQEGPEGAMDRRRNW